MSEVGDLAREVRKLKGELAELKQGLAETRGRQDVWATNGLEDLVSGHGYQRYFGGKGRLDNTGIQILGNVAIIPAIMWLPSFKTEAEMDDGGFSIAKVSGNAFSDINGAAAYLTANYLGTYPLASVVAQSSSDTGLAQLRAAGAAGGDALAGVLAYPTGRMVFRVIAENNLPMVIAIPATTTDPTFTLADFDIWGRTDLDKVRARINGVTENLATESYVAANPAGAHPFLLMGA